MANSFTFPSTPFPGYPRLRLDCPEDWVALAAVGLPLAVAKEVPSNVFRPNALVTVNRFGADHTLERTAKALDSKLKGLPRFREEAREQIAVDAGEALWVEGRFAGGRGEIIHQIVMIVVINRGYVYDVVEITGTCSALTGDNGKDELRAIVRSLTIDLD